MEVAIISRKLIKPSAPTPPHLRYTKISFIDQLVPQIHMPLIFYYPTNIDEGNIHDMVKTHDGLEKSLSDALTQFYPFAGRFIKEDFLIDCNDEGVEYVETRVSGRVDDLILKAKEKIELVNPLVPQFSEVDLNNTPLVVIQVNNFDCGGVAIVVSISHTIADAITGAAFINGWSTSNKAGVSQVVNPSFELGSAIPARPMSLPHAVVCQNENSNKVRIIAKRFVFNTTALKAKAMASAKWERPPTRNEVVCATIWRALVNTSQTKQGHLRASQLVHSVNLRGKISPLVPDNASGNFYALAAVRFELDKSNMELHDLVLLIRESTRKTVERCSKALDGDEFFWAVFNSFKEVQEILGKHEEDMDVHMFTSWCRVPFYEVDFGWGKPGWVSSSAGGVRMVCLSDTPSGEGVEAWIGLDEQDMLRFQQDQDILTFTC